MNEEIIINVQVDAEKVAAEIGALTQRLEILKGEQKRINEEFKQGQLTSAQYGAQMASVNKQIEETNRSLKSNTALLQAESIETVKASQSLDEQRQALNTLQKAYASLSGEEKKAADAKGGLRDQIKELSESVKEQEKATGDARRNVGNYESALQGLGGGLDAARKKMVALWSNPWAAIIGAIVLVIKQLIDAFKRSEDRMNELKSAFAPLQGIGDMLTRAFDALAKVVGGVLVKAFEGALRAIKTMATALDTVGKWLGKDWGLAAAFEQASERTAELTEAEQNYVKHKRRWVEEEAKLDEQISMARDKAAQKDKYTAEQRVQFLERAIALERQKANEQIKLAQEELRIAELDAARAENDEEANNRLAEARANVTRANTAYYDSVRRLQSQLVAFRAEVLATAVTEEQATEEVAKDDLKATEARERAHKAMQEKILKWTLSDIEMLEEEMRRDLETADLTAEEKIAIEKHYQAEITRIREEAAEQERERQQAETEEKIAEAEKWLGAIDDTMQSIGAIVAAKQNAELQGYENMNAKKKKDLDKRLKAGLISQEEYDKAVEAADEELAEKKYEIELKQAKQAKALGIMSTIINTAMAIMRIWADVPKMDFGASTIALTIAASAIGAAQLAAIAAEPLPQKFATGGIVGGNSYTGDQIPARLNSGEMVLNRESQQRLFDAVSGNGDGSLGFNYEMMAAAMANTPAPVLVYSELREFGQKVITFDEIASV